ncbi:tetratricopeptide repeat protein [Olleya sp. HaHaR_3_96]|uniref:tetratricopeptide repeat protein n=1 Tax=Olleya sp. HaHaR_3_96 TaxID=2745560 RepID=UPI001C4EE2EC|nr:tetratricopeptide repeat protein [Olleya sp. HaHaR_3_96]QXP61045.1 tetratricopeptide repeat protein [Olleya sp. HaHaR_3_96]
MEEQDYILFENYLSDNLSKEEHIAFEGRLSSDPLFKKTFAVYKEFSENLEYEIGNESKTADFKANLDNISFQYFNKEDVKAEAVPTKKSFKLYKYVVAASIALLMGFFVYNQFSGGASYSDFNTHETVDFAVRSGEGNVGLLIKTTKAFNDKDYEKANTYLEELLVADPENIEYNFYYAITNIELDNFAKAETILISITKGSSAYNNRAKWYLALSKLKQDENEACIAILKMIPEDADDYGQALRLLNKLN